MARGDYQPEIRASMHKAIGAGGPRKPSIQPHRAPAKVAPDVESSEKEPADPVADIREDSNEIAKMGDPHRIQAAAAIAHAILGRG